MKQIVIGFVAFLGNYNGFTQVLPAMDSIKNNPAKVRPTAAIFPNPARNRVEITVNGFSPGFIQVQLFDLNGNRVRDDRRLLVSGSEIIVVMFALQPGIYFIILRQGDKTAKRKLLVQ